MNTSVKVKSQEKFVEEHCKRLKLSVSSPAKEVPSCAEDVVTRGGPSMQETLNGLTGRECIMDDDVYLDADSQKQIYVIYPLKEPLLFPSLCYIGSTCKSLEQRFHEHRSREKSAAHSMINLGDCQIQRLNVCSQEEALREEQFFMQFFEKGGSYVLNKKRDYSRSLLKYCEVCAKYVSKNNWATHTKTAVHLRKGQGVLA